MIIKLVLLLFFFFLSLSFLPLKFTGNFLKIIKHVLAILNNNNVLRLVLLLKFCNTKEVLFSVCT